MTLDRLWAGWRSEYIASAGQEAPAGECVFCRILASGEPDKVTFVVWRGEHAAVLLNAYPYGSGHVLVMPVRHCGQLPELSDAESAAIWAALTCATQAIEQAYGPDGMNVGANLGRAAGAGIPSHLHFHALPRWNGDTNFMTAVAEARVLPETLSTTWQKLRRAWPD